MSYSVLQRANFSAAKKAAEGLLEKFGYSKPPVNPVVIARELGVEVFFVTFDEDAKNVSGFFDAEENTIFVNEEEFPLRQTFTVAHELGHKIMHAEWARSQDYRVLLRDQATYSDDPIEKEANAFAAHLLVPRFMLDKYRHVASVTELSDLFAVSIPVIQNRLKFEYGSK